MQQAVRRESIRKKMRPLYNPTRGKQQKDSHIQGHRQGKHTLKHNVHIVILLGARIVEETKGDVVSIKIHLGPEYTP